MNDYLLEKLAARRILGEALARRILRKRALRKLAVFNKPYTPLPQKLTPKERRVLLKKILEDGRTAPSLPRLKRIYLKFLPKIRK